jgi:hypothetical protein
MKALVIDIGALAMCLTYVAMAYWHAVRAVGSVPEPAGAAQTGPKNPLCDCTSRTKGASSGQVGGHFRPSNKDSPFREGVRSRFERSAHHRHSFGGGQENGPAAQRDAGYRCAARRRENDAWQRIVALRWDGGCQWR